MSLRVALLGIPLPDREAQDARIEVFDANNLHQIKTLCDFDEIVINVAGLAQLSEVSLEACRRFLAEDAVVDLLLAGSNVHIFGDPRRTLLGPPVWLPGGNHFPKLTLERTMGLSLATASEEGDRLTVNSDPQYDACARILANVTRFTQTLTIDTGQSRLLKAYVQRCTPAQVRRGAFPHLEVVPLATSRAGRPIALRLALTLVSFDGSQVMGRERGHITLYPQAALTKKTLPLILEVGCHVKLAAAPAWLSSIRTAAEDELDNAAEQAQARMSAERELLQDLESKRGQARAYLDILWLRGTALEEPVFQVLEELGATVRRPEQDANVEEAWLDIEVDGSVLHAVLEVKSTSKAQVGKDGVRQLDEWVARGRSAGAEYKGILVTNAAVELSPAQRPNPFPANVIDAAALGHHALVTTWELHRVLTAVQRGNANSSTFWKAIFTAEGPVDLTGVLGNTAERTSG